MKKLFLALFTLILSSAFAQSSVPGKPQTKSVLLMNGFLHVGNGTVIENSLVGFRNGKIDLVADARTAKVDLKSYDTLIRLEGKHIYPGFIAPNSTLGLTEVDAVRATLDFAEVGGFTPHVRALIAYNTDSKIISTVKTNGVLYCQVTPRAGVVSGTSSVVSLDAWNWEDALVKADDGIHLNFPRRQQRSWNEKSNEDPLAQYDAQMAQLRKFFSDARGYLFSSSVAEKNLYFEAMRGVFDGKKRLYVHADFARDILVAINFCKEFSITRPVLVGARDAWKVTREIREAKIPVMINRVHDLPSSNEEDIDMPFKMASLLLRDSIDFCLQNAGDMEAMNTRNLPFLAGTAAAHGLSKEQALTSITLSPARILGVDDKLGSIEQGKLASLFVSEGDALDMRTNKVMQAWVEGRSISLFNSQEAQYEKYKSKYGVK